VPYTIVVYPIVFVVLLRLWSVSHVHGYVTPADFVRARTGSPTLALLIALTGIVATMPYIALQLLGIEAVLKTVGVPGHLPIIVALAILAAYTYNAGLRAPARRTACCCRGRADCSTPLWRWVQRSRCSPTALDHRRAGRSRSGHDQAQHGRTAGLLLRARAAGTAGLHGHRGRHQAGGRWHAHLGDRREAGCETDGNTVVPLLFDQVFPDWFAGVAFAVVAIGALLPAAIMSIAAANLWTRNVYKEFLNPQATPEREAKVSKLASLVVKFGALLAILALDPQFSIDLQLIGGVIILQTLPAVALGLFTGWFHRWGLVTGWVAGMPSGFWMLWTIPWPW
jgi:solute:Na+ symporter, SSS family